MGADHGGEGLWFYFVTASILVSGVDLEIFLPTHRCYKYVFFNRGEFNSETEMMLNLFKNAAFDVVIVSSGFCCLVFCIY